MKLNTTDPLCEKARFKIIRTDDYSDLPGMIVRANEETGECVMTVSGETRLFNFGQFGIRIVACCTTTTSENAPLLVAFEDSANALVDEVVDFRKLNEGWDGENAAKPSFAAIRDAVRFIRAAGTYASRFEPTPHADGSIILEIADGVEGSLRFKGDHRIIYAARRIGVGSVPFDGSTIPETIRLVLSTNI